MFKFLSEMVDTAKAQANASEAVAALAAVRKKLDDEQAETKKLREQLANAQRDREVFRRYAEEHQEELFYLKRHYEESRKENKKLAKQVEDLMSSPDRRLDRIESYLLGLQANALGANVKVEVNNG